MFIFIILIMQIYNAQLTSSAERIVQWTNHRRCGVWKACLKWNVFNLNLKVCAEGVVRRLRGRQFQVDEATCLKAREPISSLYGGTSNRWVSDDDRSERRGITMAILDEKYEGYTDWRTLYVSVATLKSILHLIGSQCMLWGIAEMLDRPCWRVTTRASVF